MTEENLPDPNQARQKEIIEDILVERTRQDRKWGGPERDDQHCLLYWNTIIDGYNRRSESALDDVNPTDWRYRMLQVAALALAALESFDRMANASADFVETLEANPVL